MEETIATSSWYNCFRCQRVVTVDVDNRCPICQGRFIQACDEHVTKRYIELSSESEHSERDSDHEEATILQRGLYSNVTLAIVDIGSQHENNNQLDEPRHGIRVISSEWILILCGLCLEIGSAGFDQVSSPCKPHYALVGLLLAIAGVLTCIWELIHNGKKEKVVLRRRGMLWCFYYPPPKDDMLYGTFPDMFGLGLAVVQCIFSAVQYYFIHRHATNPIKLSPLPVLFFFCLVFTKLSNEESEVRR